MKGAPSSFGTAGALFSKSRKRLKYGIYFVLSLTLIVLGRIDHPLNKDIHNAIGFVVTPVIVAFDTVAD